MSSTVKSILLAVLLAVACAAAALAQPANHVVISEFAVTGPNLGADEFVELYNPGEAEVSLSGWMLQFKQSSSTVWSDRAVLPPGAVIGPHGYYLIANTSYLGAAAPDYTSDLWTSASGISSLGHLRVIDQDSLAVDKVAYGASAIDPEGTPAPSGPSSPNSLERKALSTSTADSLASGGRHFILGNGEDTDNNGADFVVQTHGRNPQNSQSVPEPSFGVGGNGTGHITVSPSKTYNAQPVGLLTFTVVGDTGYTLHRIRCAVPTSWGWSHSALDVAISGAGFDTATVTVNGDTIDIDHASVSALVHGTFTIANLTAPTLGGPSPFRCQTAVEGGTPAQLLVQPTVSVKQVVPIVNIHVNTSIGTPAAPYAVGAEVSITGTVTANLSSTQTNVFIQDGTAGVNLFSFTRPLNYTVGDSVILTGKILQFRGLLEVTPDSSTVVTVATGRPLPEPMVLTCAEVNATFQPDYTEPNEGRLIRINAVSYNAVSSTITDNSGTTDIFIPTSYPPTPSVFDVIGILKQFKAGSSPPPPYTGDYEMSPRFPSDIIGHPGPVITVSPQEDSVLATAVRVSWSTDVYSSSIIAFGTSELYTDTVVVADSVRDHSVWITGLTPATVYHYAVGSADANGTTIVGDFILSSASPAQTTGEINVYFNKTVDLSVSSGEAAHGNANLPSLFIARVNAARYSIDAALYNLSGSVGASIATALVAAHDRGVLVRIIGEADNFNAPFGTLVNAGVPVITDEFDVSTAGTELMHNKFAVFDYRGGSAESVWVWTGSWNPSDPGTNNDRQNAIEIQDVALAGAYTLEFQEMWGSATQFPSGANTRFGARKLNDTPHLFNVNGTRIQSYFSPSDRTTVQIGRVLGRAQSSVCTAMYTFTRRELADTLIAQKQRGRKVRVVMDNSSDTGTQFATLSGAGVDVHLKGFSGGLLHHKYAVVDATGPGGTPAVVTGSHNWSSSAENSNDENTIIVYSPRVANLYLQEFAARYTEAGGTDPIVLAVETAGAGVPAEFRLAQNYPNPFNPSTRIDVDVARSGLVTLKVYDLLGREVATLLDETLAPGRYAVSFDAGRLATGVYVYRVTAGGFTDVKKMMVLK
jgi:phosphatidylserine/phosphatidylglycerophosphate/cardiolipin synthase-like enzyme